MKRKWIAAASSLVLGCSAIAMPFSGAVTVQAADSRSGFVTTNGTQFMLDGSTFYYAGTNNYYINFKPKATVDAALEDAAAMGMKVVRTWGNLDAGVKTDKVSDKGYTVFTDSVDGSGEKEGVYYQYFDADLNKPVVNEGEDGLQKLDYALYKAEQEGVKLLITFTNNWEAFGGMGQYVKWAQLAGENVTGHDDFYTNETIKGWYKNYVKTLLNHENVYTGVKYKDDPTVFSWELANEPRCESDAGCEKNVVVNWAKEMSEYVKSIDSNHMLAVGDEGFYNYGYNDFPEGDHKYVYHGSSGMDFLQLTALPDIDFGTLHVYCDQWGLTREELDKFAAVSQQKAEAAQKSGAFKDEIVPVEVKKKKETVIVDTDEGPRHGTTVETLGKLKPAFKKDGGLVTAGNSSGINDGAAAVVVMSEEKAKELGVKPMATWVAGALGGVDPKIMGIGPVAATRKVLKRTGMEIKDFDIIEANEAFAAQSVAVGKELGFDLNKLNPNGGAIALGHPVGASGCRILVTLLHEMQKMDAKRGLATLCIGGGMGCSTIVERD